MVAPARLARPATTPARQPASQPARNARPLCTRSTTHPPTPRPPSATRPPRLLLLASTPTLVARRISTATSAASARHRPGPQASALCPAPAVPHLPARIAVDLAPLAPLRLDPPLCQPGRPNQQAHLVPPQPLPPRLLDPPRPRPPGVPAAPLPHHRPPARRPARRLRRPRHPRQGRLPRHRVVHPARPRLALVQGRKAQRRPARPPRRHPRGRPTRAREAGAPPRRDALGPRPARAHPRPRPLRRLPAVGPGPRAHPRRPHPRRHLHRHGRPDRRARGARHARAPQARRAHRQLEEDVVRRPVGRQGRGGQPQHCLHQPRPRPAHGPHVRPSLSLSRTLSHLLEVKS